MKNDIGFGIMCFGDDYYYRGAIEKIQNIVKKGFNCCVLTDDATKFIGIYDYHYRVHYLEYNRGLKSYYDKILLVKEILKYHEIVILIDADAHITDYSFLNQLKTYKFKEGISYPDILLNHPEKKQFVKDLTMSTDEWKNYYDYVLSICDIDNFHDIELIWEYMVIFNYSGFNQQNFYPIYEKLQIAKEFCDIRLDKNIVGSGRKNGVNGVGEGISISVASLLSKTPCQRDTELYDIIKNDIKCISRNFTRPEFWPEWMKDDNKSGVH